MPEAYQSVFGTAFLVLSLAGLFLLALRREAPKPPRRPGPTADTTKTWRLP